MISFATPWWITKIDQNAGTFVTALRTCPYVANGYRGGSLLGWSYVRLRETTRILNYDHNRFAMSSLCCNVLQFPGMVIPCKFIEDLKDTAIWDVQLAPPAGPSLFGGSGRLARNIFDDDDDVVKQDGGVRTIELNALFVVHFGVVYRSHRWDYCDILWPLEVQFSQIQGTCVAAEWGPIQEIPAVNWVRQHFSFLEHDHFSVYRPFLSTVVVFTAIFPRINDF